METEKLKTAALLQAKNALKDYLKKHKLNPMKDWREDKVHGKEVTRLVTRLNLERDKVLDNYPYNDISNETKLVKMKEKKQKAEKEAKKAKKAQKEVAAKAATQEAPAKEAKKEKKEAKAPKASVPGKYNYPLIDGREMTAAEKKKYRAEQRRQANGGEAKPKAEKKEKKAKAEAAPAPEAPKKEKKDKKAKEAVPEKPLKDKKAKKDKKKSKAKDED